MKEKRERGKGEEEDEMSRIRVKLSFSQCTLTSHNNYCTSFKVLGLLNIISALCTSSPFLYQGPWRWYGKVSYLKQSPRGLLADPGCVTGWLVSIPVTCTWAPQNGKPALLFRENWLKGAISATKRGVAKSISCEKAKGEELVNRGGIKGIRKNVSLIWGKRRSRHLARGKPLPVPFPFRTVRVLFLFSNLMEIWGE